MLSDAATGFYEQLIHHGIAARRAARAACELREHYEDLEREALESGMRPEEAAEEALERIGNVEAIAALYAHSPELKSRWNPWPRTVLTTPGGCSVLLSGTPDGAVLTRWCISACCGSLFTSTLLFLLQLILL